MHRITRYTVPAALCLSLLTASPGLASAAAESSAKPQAATAFVAAAPAGKAIPGTEALLAQVQSLGGVGGLLKPITDLLAAVLKSPDGKIPEADLAAFKEKIAAALEDLKKSLPAAPALPVPLPPVDAPALPVDPPKLPVEAPKLPIEAPKLPVEAPKLPVDAPKLPVEAPKLPVAAPALPVAAPALPVEAPKLPVAAPAVPVALPVSAHKAKPAAGPLDVVTGAIDKLKGSVDGLTKAAGPCGCSTDAKAKATDVVTDLVAALVALLTGLGLPGLPPLPVPAPPLPVPLPVQ
ncbi:hypothetical protein OHA37_18575 [Streptomyces sp. NBC_00335]|uniref:hypothetical protein n=1 Tax=unclassified Streptomyces TaxID=2593676 RepID=UPI00224DCC6A|nr:MULTISPECIES: hypothetical protein [unclassified Streptomyces]MCX5405887.1 hypothetical protein [Streptomyces sp. NBC_00086]